MNRNYQLELAATGTDPDAARQVAEALGGRLYIDERSDWQHLPFRCLVTAVTDDLTDLSQAASTGLYLVCRRTVKAGPAAAIALFPMLHNPARTHHQADAHWRDKHAPLALEHHPHMTHYTQLNVLQTLSGPTVDGFAMCGFASVDDLRERFYASKDSIRIIGEDVHRFADPANSPRRLIASLTEFSAR